MRFEWNGNFNEARAFSIDMNGLRYIQSMRSHIPIESNSLLIITAGLATSEPAAKWFKVSLLKSSSFGFKAPGLLTTLNTEKWGLRIDCDYFGMVSILVGRHRATGWASCSSQASDIQKFKKLSMPSKNLCNKSVDSAPKCAEKCQYKPAQLFCLLLSYQAVAQRILHSLLFHVKQFCPFMLSGTLRW